MRTVSRPPPLRAAVVLGAAVGAGVAVDEVLVWGGLGLRGWVGVGWAGLVAGGADRRRGQCRAPTVKLPALLKRAPAPARHRRPLTGCAPAPRHTPRAGSSNPQHPSKRAQARKVGSSDQGSPNLMFATEPSAATASMNFAVDFGGSACARVGVSDPAGECAADQGAVPFPP